MSDTELAPRPPKKFPYSPQDLQGLANKYEIIYPIHIDTKTQVFSAKHVNASGFFAVKFSVLTDRLENEMRAGELTSSSQYVVDYVDGRTNDDASLGFVVTPYTFHDLGESKKGQKGCEKSGLRTLAGISRGLIDLHGVGLVHRDIKPKNIFLKGLTGDQPIVGDLGSVCENGYLDNFYEEETANILPNPDVTSSTDIVITAGWAAPEQYDRSKRLTNKVDVFGFGLVACDLLTEVNPAQRALKVEYPGLEKLEDNVTARREQLEALTQLAGDTENFFRYIPKEHVLQQSRAIRKLLDQCLSSNPVERPDSEELSFILEREVQRT